MQFERRVADKELHGQRMNVLVRRVDLHPVAISGYLSPHAPRSQAWSPDAEEAVAIALADLGVDAGPLRAMEMTHGSLQFEQVDGTDGVTFGSPARARPTWYAARDTLVPSWFIELDLRVRGVDLPVGTAFVIAADTWQVLQRTNQVHTEAYTYRVWAHADGSPMANPLGDAFTPYPVGQNPLAAIAPVGRPVAARRHLVR